jgi:hypothetical protein
LTLCSGTDRDIYRCFSALDLSCVASRVVQMSSAEPREETLPNYIKAAQKVTVDWDAISKRIQVIRHIARPAASVRLLR